MGSKGNADIYTNRSLVNITMDTLNTLKFQQIRFAAGLFEGIALLLNRIQYHLDTASAREMVASTDLIQLALTSRNDLSTLDPTNLSIYDRISLIGVGANDEPIKTPIISDFTNLPGGGLLIPANPLYLGMYTLGAAAASSCNVTLEYQYKKLSDKEGIELLQTLLPGTV